MRYLVAICLLVFSSIHGAPPQKIHKFLLITGTGRCGTKYISQLLQKNGLDIGHERYGRDGISSCVMVANTPFEPEHHRPCRKNAEFTHIFHQVRHPLHCIPSLCSFFNSMVWWNFACSLIPEMKPQDPKVVMCAKYWYYWNLEAEKIAEWTYKIEDIERIYNEMGKRLGRTFDKNALEQVSKNTHTFPRPEMSWSWEKLNTELTKYGHADLFQKIRKLAKRYGYN